jgi:hypothetical protein
VPAAVSRAQDIAARLSAAECDPRVSRHRDHIRIEVDVPESLSPLRWRIVLTALEGGDRFGLQDTAEGRIAWALVSTEDDSGTTDREQPTGPKVPRSGRHRPGDGHQQRELTT